VSENQSFLELSGIHAKGDYERIELSNNEFPILKDLSPLNMRILNDTSRVIHAAKGVEIMHEGDNPHDLYFIKKGKVAVARHVGAQQKVAAVIGAGDLFGEFGLLRKKPRVASVFTAEDSVLIRVKSSAVYQVLQADSSFKERLEHLLSCRLLNAFLFNHASFHSLSEITRTSLSNEFQTTYVNANKRIFSQGDKPNGIHLIISGEVEVTLVNQSGQDILLEVRRNGDLLGEIATNDGTALAYSATASSNLDVLIINKSKMKRLRERYPDAFKLLEQYIGKRTERTAIRLKSLTPIT